MNTDTLPPLPEPKVYASDAFDAYTTEQLREYARAAIAAHVPEAVCGNIAAVPAHPVIRTLSPEQIERHTFKASECPPDSVVMLVSSINRLLSKRPGEGIRLSQPVAWLCSLMMEDGTTRTQIVEQDPAGLRWNDDGEPSPYKVQPLYAAPQAVPVPAWQPIETAPKDRDVLVACSHGLYVARYCDHGIEWWHVDDNKHGPFPLRGSSPTHWMPLPAAPKEQP